MRRIAVALGVLMGGLYGGLVAFACFSLVATTSMAILGCIAHASAEASLGPAMDATLKAIDMGLGFDAIAFAEKPGQSGMRDRNVETIGIIVADIFPVHRARTQGDAAEGLQFFKFVRRYLIFIGRHHLGH